MHRRKKTLRWLSVAVASGAVAAGAFAYLPALAEATGDNEQKDVQLQFQQAATEYQVPLAVLMGVAHEESGWLAHKGYSTGGGWGLMNLTDVTPQMLATGDAGAAGRKDMAAVVDRPQSHTLQKASDLTGISEDDLRHDTGSNIRGGAALLASYQKQLAGKVGGKPSDWTGAVARYSQMSDKKAAKGFADDVFHTIRSGGKGKVAADQSVHLSADPSAQPSEAQVDRLKLKDVSAPEAECPATVNCQFVPADPSNGQVSDRPANGIKITEIVLHTTEESYADTITTFQTPGGSSAQYVMQSSDGAVTQMVPNKDVAFGDGNYWSNLHSVQIEHEGFSARGAEWYTDAAYKQTARLVQYLAARYGVPLDRQHIVGHDDVPAPSDSGLAGQHWDPGYAWDWSRFMRLVGSPTDLGRHGVGPVGSAVTIAPGFAGNEQSYTVCPEDDPTGGTPECTKITAPSNSLFVRSAPADDAPLLLDPVLHPDATAGTDRVNDWSDTVQDGQQFVVAGKQGDWTAIWFDGQKGWIHNPGGRNTLPAHGVRIVKAAGDTAAPVYGTAYPDAAEYPAGHSPSTQKPLTAANYKIPAGQAYVADQQAVPSDDFFAKDGVVVTGAKKYYTIQFNHRYVQVDSADVTATR
ncbi:N-acetylmuramoyl-L-alanine amidase [Streptomyces sp. TS71-3]|uniref:peptidoglycan recognition protein family protein n=1 Tax=Streptomyces sp. TS71-3 TaxID=2733862 RepID=UPI001B187600|nr:N-acetylmuramoyl-L-alanine amidase [Streptomyces sp. TS71-3]GHJ37453.1 amidase [Streptomyces sp. TS71-3]